MSRYCRELVEPWLWRSIELSDASKYAGQTEAPESKLLQPHNSLSRYVQDLRISCFNGNSPEFDEVCLEMIIGRLSRLRSFRYPSCFPSLWHFMILFADRFQLEYQHPYTRTCDKYTGTPVARC